MTVALATVACVSIAQVAGNAQTVQAKNGTEVNTYLQAPLSSKTNHNGDTFQLLEKDGFFHHAPPALKGATFDGHLENVSPAGPTHKATMNLVFDDVVLANGTKESVSVKLEKLQIEEPKTHHVRDVGLIIGGFAAGHMMAGSHHGGMAGAAAGFALATTLKSDIKISANTLVQLKLTSDLTGQ